MNEFVKIFQSNGTVIAAIVALIGVLIAEWLNRKKFKVDMQKMNNEFQQRRETETEWGKQVFEISAMKSSDMDEDALLKVRNLLGPMQIGYKTDKARGGEENTDKESLKYEIDKARYKFWSWLKVSERHVSTIDYYENFKNEAIDYVDYLHEQHFEKENDVNDSNNIRKIWLPKNKHNIFSEDEAESLRMICQVLRQDSWITKAIAGKESYLENEFSFLYRLSKFGIFSNEGQISNKKKKEKKQCKISILSIFSPSVFIFVAVFIFLDKDRLSSTLLAVAILLGILYLFSMFTIMPRYNRYNSIKAELQELVSRKEAQQKKAGEILKEYLEENDQNYKKRNNAIQQEEEEKQRDSAGRRGETTRFSRKKRKEKKGYYQSYIR